LIDRGQGTPSDGPYDWIAGPRRDGVNFDERIRPMCAGDKLTKLFPAAVRRRPAAVSANSHAAWHAVA
jgi:hypothetical protein